MEFFKHRKSEKVPAQKKKSKRLYDHVKSRVDTKQPASMRLKSTQSTNSKAKPKNMKKARSAAGSMLSGLGASKKKQFLKEIATELLKEQVSQYFAIPDDLKI